MLRKFLSFITILKTKRNVATILLSTFLLLFFFTNCTKKTYKTTVVIVSEQQSMSHLAIYGYPENTTPYLSKLQARDDLIIFDKTVANHSNTSSNLASLLEISKDENLLNFFVANNYTVYTYSKSDLPNNVKKKNTQLASEEDVMNTIQQPAKANRLFFIYQSKDQTTFCPTPLQNKTTNDQGYIGKSKLKNTALLHKTNQKTQNIDCFISNIIQELEQQPSQENSLWYVAERGVDITSTNNKYLGFNTAHVPFFVWMNDITIANNRMNFENLKSNSNKWSGTLNFSKTITQFSSLDEKKIKGQSLTSSNFQLDLESLSIFNGRMPFKSAENFKYFQEKNAEVIEQLNETSRVFPHRVNSIGKLKQVWNDGYRSFEVDVMFDKNNTREIVVGHNEGDTGVSLKDFLLQIDITQVGKIWLDFKNLTAIRQEIVKSQLNLLDAQYNFKDKVILETSCKEAFLANFKQEGWHTSYYLPTQDIIKLSENNDVTALKALATSISNQIKVQQMTAISFDNRLYPFVQQQLEPMLPAQTVYHMWYGPQLNTPNFIEELEKLPFYKNDRVKTILCRYHSEFDL